MSTLTPEREAEMLQVTPDLGTTYFIINRGPGRLLIQDGSKVATLWPEEVYVTSLPAKTVTRAISISPLPPERIDFPPLDYPPMRTDWDEARKRDEVLVRRRDGRRMVASWDAMPRGGRWFVTYAEWTHGCYPVPQAALYADADLEGWWPLPGDIDG